MADWERVNETPYRQVTERLKVDGGWIYRTQPLLGETEPLPFSMTYVPDPTYWIRNLVEDLKRYRVGS